LATTPPNCGRLASHLYLFGSVARDEAKSTSDVDPCSDFDALRFSLMEQCGRATGWQTFYTGRRT
jgi:hypothetical protein